MRVAPAGLVGDDPFDLGCRLAAITHGHATGWLSAGVFAAAIAGLLDGSSLLEAVDAALGRLRTYPGHTETLQAVDAALWLAKHARRAPETVERLGSGWVAEEALAIALYCALTADGFDDGVLLAVNHGGDSDSTGSLTGNLLGTLLGADAIPFRWLADLELRDEIEQVAQDLFAAFVLTREPSDEEPQDDRYPGW
jgi:ADP-ribosylglycohydrolase